MCAAAALSTCSTFRARICSLSRQCVASVQPSRCVQALAGEQWSRRLFLLPTPYAMDQIAGIFGHTRMKGDVYLLYGNLGAGKSAFSRAFIRHACEDDDLPVPSPTFLLLNTYDETDGPDIHHFDLYRLQEGSNMQRLDLQQAMQDGVCLIEWPSRLASPPAGAFKFFPATGKRLPAERFWNSTIIAMLSCGASNPTKAEAPQEQEEAATALLHKHHVSAPESKPASEEERYEDHRWRVLGIESTQHDVHQRFAAGVTDFAQWDEPQEWIELDGIADQFGEAILRNASAKDH